MGRAGGRWTFSWPSSGVSELVTTSPSRCGPTVFSMIRSGRTCCPAVYGPPRVSGTALSCFAPASCSSEDSSAAPHLLFDLYRAQPSALFSALLTPCMLSANLEDQPRSRVRSSPELRGCLPGRPPFGESWVLRKSSAKGPKSTQLLRPQAQVLLSSLPVQSHHSQSLSSICRPWFPCVPRIHCSSPPRSHSCSEPRFSQAPWSPLCPLLPGHRMLYASHMNRTVFLLTSIRSRH